VIQDDPFHENMPPIWTGRIQSEVGEGTYNIRLFCSFFLLPPPLLFDLRSVRIRNLPVTAKRYIVSRQVNVAKRKRRPSTQALGFLFLLPPPSFPLPFPPDLQEFELRFTVLVEVQQFPGHNDVLA